MIQSSQLRSIFLSKMATLRNKRKLAAVRRETQEENPRNGQSRNTSVPRINEEYITQVSEQIEGRVTEKLSQEFSRAESRILGALSKLDEFLLNQQIQTHSETVPGTFRNTNVENQGTNEDDSQSDPHPKAGIFCGQTTQNFGPKGCRNRVFCKTRMKKSSLSMFNFCVILLDHGMFSDTSIATKFRPRFQVRSVPSHFRGNFAEKASHTFVEKILNDHEFLIVHDE